MSLSAMKRRIHSSDQQSNRANDMTKASYTSVTGKVVHGVIIGTKKIGTIVYANFQSNESGTVALLPLVMLVQA
jgi:hypothetical protein